MYTNTHTEGRTLTRRGTPKKVPTDYNYRYVRIGYLNTENRWTSCSIPTAEYDTMLRLAQGSSVHPVERVGAVIRESAAALTAVAHTGKMSIAIRRKALAKLRGAFRAESAAAFEAAQFPDGVPAQT